MIIFVGDTPSPRMKEGAKPFQGAICEARLLSWIKELSYGMDIRVVNRTDYYFGITKHLFHRRGDKIIALGNNASKALGDIPHFKLPHPSGRNRQINNKKFIDKKLKECREWLTSNSV